MYLDRTFLNALAEHEGGRVAHMYCDSNGFVTVGTGHLLRDAPAAGSLPGWRFRSAGQTKPPQPAEIIADWKRVKEAFRGNHAAAYYGNGKHAGSAQLELPLAQIDALFERDVAVKAGELQRRFAGWIDIPVPAKQGLLDMAFNLGTNGVITKFPSFSAAVRAADWEKAATESKRRGISADRNAWTKNLLLEAAKQARSAGGVPG